MRIPALLLLAAAAAFPQARPVSSNDPGGPNLPAQRIGPNDLLAVSVYDAPEFTRTVRVSADGNIRLPMLRQLVPAAGLLPADLESAIAKALAAEQILVDPYVTVTIVEYDSRPISVAGAVKSPVTFQATTPVSLLEAITRAGGLSPDAGPEILVTRLQTTPGGPPLSLTRRVSVRALIDAADPDVNLRLTGGEEVRVPEVGKVFVVGNVKKPGAFSLDGDSESTVLKAIALSEGLDRFAAKLAYIYRRDDRSGAKNEIPVQLAQIMKRKSPDVPLLANDILYIPDNTGRRATLGVLEKVAGFGAATASGIIIWSSR